MSDPALSATGRTVSVTVDGVTSEFPVLAGTDGRSAVDMSKFTAQTGLHALDYGFVNTASTRSAITYIDGDAGVLRYRGYPIEQVATSLSFLETAWLLIYGEIPSASELEEFEQNIQHHTLLHEDLKNFFSGFPRNAHPMPVLSAGVSALSTY